MKSFVYHIQISVSDSTKSFSFYKDLLGYLDYKISCEDETTLGMANGTCDVWVIQTDENYKENKYHRKNVGLNHIALGVYSKDDVDKFVEEFLKPRNINPLYNSPKEFKEYQEGYYAVYFEDPDRIKLEVVYIPRFISARN